MSKDQKSDVWKLMTKLECGKKCKCNLCSKILSYHGGTTNLREHLSAVHAREYIEITSSATETKQSKLTSFFRGSCDSSHSRKITDLIANVICRDLRPISIIDGVGFQELLQYLEPEYKVPLHTHMASVIYEKHRVGKEKLKKLLHQPQAVALTTDSWTSCSNESYITITAHFVCENWKMVSCVLETKAMDEKHSAENLAERLITTVADWGLKKSQICALVHDNAVNMTRMNQLLVEDMECETWISVPCTAHTLQLAINAGLTQTSVHESIGACRKLVGHFRHSTRAAAELRKEQIVQGTAQHELVQDVVTRWNSVLYMAERALEQRWTMSKVLSDPTITPNRHHRNLDLQNHQWELLTELVKVLKPLEMATTLFCYEQQASLSCVLPIIMCLVQLLDTTDGELPAIVQVKKEIRDQLRKRWLLDDIQTKSSMVLSAALDPRFKSLNFLTGQQIGHVKSTLINMCMKMENERNEISVIEHGPAPKRPKPTSAWDLLLGDEEHLTPDHDVNQECEKYWMEKAASRDSDPLVWWSMHSSSYPSLSIIAKKCLCIPATSAPSERVSSSAGLTIMKLRNLLSPETALSFCRRILMC